MGKFFVLSCSALLALSCSSHKERSSVVYKGTYKSSPQKARKEVILSETFKRECYEGGKESACANLAVQMEVKGLSPEKVLKTACHVSRESRSCVSYQEKYRDHFYTAYLEEKCSEGEKRKCFERAVQLYSEGDLDGAAKFSGKGCSARVEESCELSAAIFDIQQKQRLEAYEQQKIRRYVEEQERERANAQSGQVFMQILNGMQQIDNQMQYQQNQNRIPSKTRVRCRTRSFQRGYSHSKEYIMDCEER